MRAALLAGRWHRRDVAVNNATRDYVAGRNGRHSISSTGHRGSLTTAKKKRRGVTSCKRTNSVAVKSSFLVNNERDLKNKITSLDIKLKCSRVARKIGSRSRARRYNEQ